MTRTSWRPGIAAACVAALLGGCGRGAERVVDEFQAHVSTGRMGAAAALLTPDAIIVFDGTTYRGRDGAARWFAAARRRHLGFPVARAEGTRLGWKVEGDRVRGLRRVEGEGYRSGQGAAKDFLTMEIDAVVRGGRIARISYQFTPAAKATYEAAVLEQARRLAAVFDGPPPSYQLNRFAPAAELVVGTTRVSGSTAITAWALSNRPATSPGALTVSGNVARWQGTFTTGKQREEKVTPPAARFEIEMEGLPAPTARIRRYRVIFAVPPASAASQPAPASAPAGSSQPLR